jgi:hypothetical protein
VIFGDDSNIQPMVSPRDPSKRSLFSFKHAHQFPVHVGMNVVNLHNYILLSKNFGSLKSLPRFACAEWCFFLFDRAALHFFSSILFPNGFFMCPVGCPGGVPVWAWLEPDFTAFLHGVVTLAIDYDYALPVDRNLVFDSFTDE